MPEEKTKTTPKIKINHTVPREISPVIVEWIDSARGSGWVFTDDLNTEALKCISIGAIVKETEDAIIIGSSLTVSGTQVCGDMTIPRCAIKNITHLKSIEKLMTNHISQKNEPHLDVNPTDIAESCFSIMYDIANGMVSNYKYVSTTYEEYSIFKINFRKSNLRAEEIMSAWKKWIQKQYDEACRKRGRLFSHSQPLTIYWRTTPQLFDDIEMDDCIIARLLITHQEPRKSSEGNYNG